MTMLALAFVGLVQCGELAATEAAQVHEREDASGDAPDQNAWLKPQGPRQMHPHIPATSNVGEGSLVDHMVLCGKKAVAGVHDFFYDEKGDFQRERAQLMAAFVAGMVVRGRIARVGAIWSARYKK